MTPDIYRVLKYFSFFQYPPSEEEIYTFLASKYSRTSFKSRVQGLVQNKKIKMGEGHVYPWKKVTKYTLGRYGIFLKKNIQFSKYSQSKLERIILFIRLLKSLPSIEFAGLSGSISMMHAKKYDDVDLFIITASGRLWTGRFYANLLAFSLGLKRKRLSQQAKDKVCLNLFFDNRYLAIPSKKRNRYVAHEILQLKPVFDKRNTYGRFIEANSWIFDLYPNAKTVLRNSLKLQPKGRKVHKNSFGNMIEGVLKRIQLPRIMKHKTTEIVTAGQLWFFPDDFEAKIMKYNRLG